MNKNIPIVRISKKGEFIKEWPSVSQAIRKTGLKSIGAALQRVDTFFVDGSMWLYKDEYKDIEDITIFVKHYKMLRYIDKRTFMNIRQYNKEGVLLNTFDTLEEAVSETGSKQIKSALKGLQKTANGFVWKSDIVTDIYRENIRNIHNMDLDVKKAFIDKFGSIEGYYSAKKIYENTNSFAPNGNIFETEAGKEWDDKVHFIMRWTTGNHIKNAFKAMKIDITDDNVSQNLKEGNIGTYQRIAKVWCGDGTHDDRELGSGRWSVKPRLASFPNTGNKTIPITKRVDIISNCSHHNIVFSTLQREDSYAVISYIPDEEVLGISKLQRITDWVSQRYWLQEDLTKKLFDEVALVAKTESVLVALINVTHGCESFRGAKANDGAFTSMHYGGKFEDADIRNSVLNNA